MRLYDISMPLRSGMPQYPGEPGPRMWPLKQRVEGFSENVSVLSLGLHAGTHVSAPDAEALTLDSLCGPARVIAIEDIRAVTVAELERAGLHGARRVLFKTRNAQLRGEAQAREDSIYVSAEAAGWLVEADFKLIGIDYLSIERFGAERPRARRLLLDAGVVVLEGLDLSEVAPGDYELWCLPLKIPGADGAPARAVLAQRP